VISFILLTMYLTCELIVEGLKEVTVESDVQP